jgi:hypothetical protein
MNNQEKAIIYDDCIRQVEVLQRENSRLKSQYVTNIPQHIQKVISENEIKISKFVKKLESLF